MAHSGKSMLNSNKFIVLWQLRCVLSRQKRFFLCSPQIFTEYLPEGRVQSAEEINVINPVSVLNGDVNYYGKCYMVCSYKVTHSSFCPQYQNGWEQTTQKALPGRWQLNWLLNQNEMTVRPRKRAEEAVGAVGQRKGKWRVERTLKGLLCHGLYLAVTAFVSM